MPITWKPTDHDPATPADALVEFACLAYGLDHVSRRDKARNYLAEANRNIHTAAVTGDVETARRFLDEQPDLVNQPGGPRGWPPLLYACFARLDRSTYDVACLLLDRGADPNAGFLWDGVYPFTALTGVFGEGESGPKQQPRHPDDLALARRLLEAGADPNDSQSLYNRIFRPGTAHLELLFEFGLGSETNNPWLAQSGDPSNTPTLMLTEQLYWACERDMMDRVELLVKHNADLNAASYRNNRTPWETATVNGNPHIAQYLADHGAKPSELNEADRFAAAVLAGNRADKPADLGDWQHDLTTRAAQTGKCAAIRLLVDMGFDLNPTDRRTPLHEAAWFGHMDTVQLLLDLGADPAALDPHHNATPAGFAEYAGEDDIAALLASA